MVEDDTKLVRAIVRGLERAGYTVELASSSGDQKRPDATANESDAVVLDVMLPGAHGYGVCRACQGSLEPLAAVEVADLRVDAAARVVTRGGRQIALTPREFAVLELLARNVGHVVPRTLLLERVWGASHDLNVVDVYVGYLRKKLELPCRRPLIRTVRGVGFLLEA